MNVWGIAALSHDAALAVVRDDALVFAAHAERYSRRKNDPELSQALIDEAAAFGAPDVIAWYERPLLKKTRHVRAGQWRWAAAVDDLPRAYLRRFRIEGRPRLTTVRHHLSHAAGGYFTSDLPDACVVIIDAIGEWETATIGLFTGARFRMLRRVLYPHSLGLLYSAFTRRCGFRPNEDEYIVMGLAPYGRPRHAGAIRRDFLEEYEGGFRLRVNVHRGIGDWLPDAAPADLAASIQQVTEEVLVNIATWARRRTGSENLVLMGGVALNCVANARIARESGFRRIRILPCPGDAGSSVGAAAAFLGRHVRWPGPYLGTEIARPLPVRDVLDALVHGHVVGIANGRAEFGPRALGNRSLLADPRQRRVRDRVNAIKGREPFRPFAPAVLEEHAPRYFDLPVPSSPYMQFVARCRVPDLVPGVVHVDGTSRVQTLAPADGTRLHDIVRGFFDRTGCPLLLNTSLNVKGEPLVNTWGDAARFAAAAAIPVF